MAAKKIETREDGRHYIMQKNWLGNWVDEKKPIKEALPDGSYRELEISRSYESLHKANLYVNGNL